MRLNDWSKMNDVKGKRVTVVGLGEHGGAIGNILWLHKQGARLVVTDLKNAEQLAESIKMVGQDKGIEWVLGEHRAEDFTRADLVIINPGVPRNLPFLLRARAAGVPVEMDSSLFFRWFDRRRIIGVTGSKGKSTTTTAIAALLGIPAIGIEGTSPLLQLEQLNNDKKVVFELSSWRLEPLAAQQISPGTAIITAIYRDHLNTYASWEEYMDVKKIIVKWQQPTDRAILNFDDERLRAWSTKLISQVISYSIKDYKTRGIFIKHNHVMVRELKGEERLMDTDELPARYEHEIRNLLPAIYLAWQQGMNKEQIIGALRKVRLLPHRMETVAVIGKVEFINDSAATMPDATIAALAALQGKTIVHILGGNDKVLEFAPWAQQEAIANVRHIIWLPGTATEKMAQAYERAGGRSQAESATDMADAVRRAAQIAQAEDIVLLSPGATSFSSFKNEFDRGNKFKEAVRNLQKHA